MMKFSSSPSVTFGPKCVELGGASDGAEWLIAAYAYAHIASVVTANDWVIIDRGENASVIVRFEGEFEARAFAEQLTRYMQGATP